MTENVNVLIRKFEVQKWFIKKIKKFEELEHLKSEQISIVIIGDQRMRTMNKKYRKKDRTTDVLSFAQCDIPRQYKIRASNYLGEIFINFRQAQRQSKEIKKEMLRLLIHGYLHLKGYTHNNEQDLKKMNRKTELMIKKII